MEHSDDRGSVLVLVLVMVTLLTGLLVEFNYRSRIDVYATENALAAERALTGSQACLEVARALIRFNDPTSEERLRALSDGARFELGDTWCSIDIEDQGAKLNINRFVISSADHTADFPQLMLILRDVNDARSEPGDVIQPEFVPSLIDWLDEDDDVTSLELPSGLVSGAERDYYSRLSPPLSPRNGPIDSVEELRRVRGLRSLRPGSEVAAALLDRLTAFGDGRQNLNTTDPAKLRTLSIPEDQLQLLLEAREESPLASVKDIAERTGIDPDLLNSMARQVTVESVAAFYRVRTTGHYRHASRTIDAMIRKDVDGKLQTIMRLEF